MSRLRHTLLLASILTASACAAWAAGSDAPKPADSDAKKTAHKVEFFEPEAVTSNGSVTIGGHAVAYQAVAGTLVVHPRGWDDVRDPNADKDDSPVASIFYVAYFRTGAGPRPVTFVYNGGPGSSTMWLHLGAFGPRRIVTSTGTHTPAAPYSLVNNEGSLLDATDLVFIDAPGAGFSRIAGKDKEKAFYGVDPDAYAFAEFITQFLTKYGRWNSPKFLFGESYGTPRSAVLINELESSRSIDFNGVILLSQILSFDLSADRPTTNPGVDVAYETALPTYAATAWYHKKLSGQYASLDALLAEVERFALGDYARALAQGSELTAAERTEVATKLHQYTGLPLDYILKADLRIDGGEFRQQLQADSGLATGRLDTRFSGPDLDLLSERAEYDPQSTALSSAYVSAFNDYARKELHYGADKVFKPSIGTFRSWNWAHPDTGQTRQATNVMPDLANAMKINPNLKIQLHGGYYDLATPFFEGIYEMHHLPIPQALQNNIEYHYYESGHMVYAKEDSLRQLHDNVTAFIRRNSNLSQ
jgi:carboxypeptidase C (cathepsin A)